MRILVVDDEEAIRLALGELLASAGHEVREAETGDVALAALEGAAADLVLADLRMPGMDGMQLLEAIRGRFPETLVVLVTAQGDERTAVQALKLGAYDYLPKPFDNEEIRATVRHAQPPRQQVHQHEQEELHELKEEGEPHVGKYRAQWPLGQRR